MAIDSTDPNKAIEIRASVSRQTATRYQLAGLGVLALLAFSAAALASAPLLLPPSYSWVKHSVSESGAQGAQGAWLARLGFLLFGLAVLWVVSMAAPRWGRLGATLHGAFGVMMLAVAAFSHRHWNLDMPFDRVEDILHSVAATTMGFSYTLGVAWIAGRRLRAGYGVRPLDVLAVLSGTLLPLGMTVWPPYAGLLQRGMFLIGYLWYAHEALASHRQPSD